MKRPKKFRSKQAYAAMLAVFGIIFVAAIVAMLFYSGVFPIK